MMSKGVVGHFGQVECILSGIQTRSYKETWRVLEEMDRFVIVIMAIISLISKLAKCFMCLLYIKYPKHSNSQEIQWQQIIVRMWGNGTLIPSGWGQPLGTAVWRSLKIQRQIYHIALLYQSWACSQRILYPTIGIPAQPCSSPHFTIVRKQ